MYLSLKRKIKELEEAAQEEKEEIRRDLFGSASVELPPGGEALAWTYTTGVVAVVKGRVSEKLDRVKLARAGVSGDVLDAATVRTEGEPSLRIMAPETDA